MAAHYKDLRETYAKRMEYHGERCSRTSRPSRLTRALGNGYGLLQPVHTADLTPPCCGFFDLNGDWNPIAHLTADPATAHPAYTLLAYPPRRVAGMQIEWQPKTSLGVTSTSVDTSLATPNNIPGGADAHVKYATSSKFGAVLMATKPVTLHAYNDERLFRAWLAANRAALSARHGAELRRYGLWLVTRTHSARGCSVNAWVKANRSALVSVKAKAAMMGELGESLDIADEVFDKDWCHYRSRAGKDGGEEAGLVLFMDGIEVKPLEWWVEGAMQTLFGRALSPGPAGVHRRAEPAHPAMPRPLSFHPQPTTAEKGMIDGFHDTIASEPAASPPRRSRRSHRDRPTTLVADDDDDDLGVLQDAGMLQFGRAASLRQSSCPGSMRSHSLRRESRSVADEKEKMG